MPTSCNKHTMDSLHPSFTPYPSLLQSALRLSPTPLPLPSLSLSPIPHPAPMPSTSRRLQCNSNIERVLLYPVYVCYIVILFASLPEEATIKAKRFIIMFLKRVSRYIVYCRQVQVGDCYITIPIYTLTVTHCSFTDP